LRTAYRLGQAIAIQSARAPDDSALVPARKRLRAFRDSLTAGERLLIDSF
jgi:predicted RecB family endonuclease